jgi:hypothetical protein
LELQSEALTSEKLELLNLGPDFSITTPTIPYMDLACPIETGAAYLESQGRHEDADILRQASCDILKKAKAPKSNLTFRQRRALNDLKKEKGISIAPYDKGKGFVVLNKEDLERKAFAEMDKVKFDQKDGTKKLEKQIATMIDKLFLEAKISEDQKKDLKSPDSIAPASWPAIKAHKPQKDYPARNVVSHIGCPQENLAKFLISLLHPLTKNDPYNCKNSVEIADAFRNKVLDESFTFVSYDATALFPNIPIGECIKLIYQQERERY